jgi:hypothetical protein
VFGLLQDEGKRRVIKPKIQYSQNEQMEELLRAKLDQAAQPNSGVLGREEKVFSCSDSIKHF